MVVGIFIHKIAKPRPKSPSFFIKIDSTISRFKGQIELAFYVPVGYCRPSHVSTERSSVNRNTNLYPVIISFHGGGFTLGSNTDDARWASAITKNVDAVVVSVGYRLAPEHPFPTAVQDGVDAFLWIRNNGKSLGLDSDKVGFSGFSSGGNLCFSVSLMLQEELKKRNGRGDEWNEVAKIKPRALISWYPTLDYTIPREERRASNLGGPEKPFSNSLDDLFDAAYIYPRESVALDNPLLSPAMATESSIASCLPEDIILITCEWDQLMVEGEAFRAKLKKLGKRVKGRMIPRVKHGWNLQPMFFSVDGKAQMIYEEACAELKSIFDSSYLVS